MAEFNFRYKINEYVYYELSYAMVVFPICSQTIKYGVDLIYTTSFGIFF